MRSSTSSTLHAPFWRWAALTLAWWALPLGVFAISQGSATWGVFLTILGIAAVVFALSGRLIQWGQARPRSRPLASLLIVSYVLAGFFELWQALQSYPVYVIPRIPAVVHALILLALAAVTTWQLMKSRPS